jgi:hypothetical protein
MAPHIPPIYVPQTQPDEEDENKSTRRTSSTILNTLVCLSLAIDIEYGQTEMAARSHSRP